MSALTASAAPLDILGLGLCTPVGLTARATQVEIAAGTVRFVLTGVEGPRGDEVRASVHPLLDEGPSMSSSSRRAAGRRSLPAGMKTRGTSLATARRRG